MRLKKEKNSAAQGGTFKIRELWKHLLTIDYGMQLGIKSSLLHARERSNRHNHTTHTHNKQFSFTIIGD